MNAYFDTIIDNGTIIDGSGTAGFTGYVAIDGGRIVRIGKGRFSNPRAHARRVVDATDKVVTPGFIDSLSHSLGSLFVDGMSTSKLVQGVTTEVLGERTGVAPMGSSATALVQREALGPVGVDNFVWSNADEYGSLIEEAGIGVNVAFQIPAAMLRAAAGDDPWTAVAPESKAFRSMCNELEKQLGAGATGLTFVFEEAPCSTLTERQITQLLSLVTEAGALARFHMRDEANELLASIDEVISLVGDSGCAVEILHLKQLQLHGREDLTEAVFSKLDKARSEGVQVGASIYPYTIAGLALQQLINGLMASDPAEISARLGSDRDFRDSTRQSIAQLTAAGVWDSTWLAFDGAPALTVTDAAAAQDVEPDEVVLHFLSTAKDWCHCQCDVANDNLLAELIERPWVTVVTDGANKYGGAAGTSGRAHPREFGTFPRFVRRALHAGVGIEEVVRRITSLPASRHGLVDRGQIATGYAADVLVFDPGRFVDLATVEQPDRLAEGLDWCFVNGEPVLESGVLQASKSGRFLKAKF